jgi:hypothetical protein
LLASRLETRRSMWSKRRLAIKIAVAIETLVMTTVIKGKAKEETGHEPMGWPPNGLSGLRNQDRHLCAVRARIGWIGRSLVLRADFIWHIVFYGNFSGTGLPQNRVDVPPSFPTTACIAAEIDDNLRSNSSSAN